jgi:type I restriction enzyme S subunit
MSPYKLQPLAHVLTERKEFITISDDETYVRPRVQQHAKGIVVRDKVPGNLIKTKKQQVCRTGELLVARIDAKFGGFGIVPPELDGAIVNSNYFLFELDEQQIDRKFLDYYLRTPQFQDQVNAQGSTNYAAIRQSDVLSYRVPLPPLSEQRRIVARIEELASRIEEIISTREEISRYIPMLLDIDEQYTIVKHMEHLRAKVNELQRQQQDSRATLDALLPSILDKAFKGEL